MSNMHSACLIHIFIFVHMSGALINQTASKDITWADNAYWGGSALGAEELKGLRLRPKVLDKK